jgi:NAD(P)-dependent dehydrogenase (short-subunit alcohol dehydrogenase family)
MKLENKVAIVTGGAQGIGQAIAEAYVREGADVAIADIDIETAKATASELQKLGRRVIAVYVDVADEDLVNKMVDKVVAELGHVDILVNDAGITSFHQFLDLPVDVFDRTVAVNLRGPFLCTRKVAKHMVEQKRKGVVINITSMGQEITTEVEAHYAASKGGLKMLTKSMALSLAKHKIRVNGIAPGPVISSIKRTLTDVKDSPERQTRLMTRIPFYRPGKPSDIAGAAVFLASDDSAYMLGSIIFVDGGVSSLGLAKNYD